MSDNKKQSSEAELPEDNPVKRGEKAIEAAKITDTKSGEESEEESKADAEKWRNEG